MRFAGLPKSNYGGTIRTVRKVEYFESRIKDTLWLKLTLDGPFVETKLAGCCSCCWLFSSRRLVVRASVSGSRWKRKILKNICPSLSYFSRALSSAHDSLRAAFTLKEEMKGGRKNISVDVMERLCRIFRNFLFSFRSSSAYAITRVSACACACARASVWALIEHRVENTWISANKPTS